MGVREAKMGGEDLMGRYNKHDTNKSKYGTNINKSLSVLTFNISDDLLDMLEYGKSRGWWVSRSEGMRCALRAGLSIVMEEHEAMNLKIIEKLQQDNTLDPNKKYVRLPGRGYIEIIGEA